MAHLRTKLMWSLGGIALGASVTAFAAGNWKKHPVLHKAYESLEMARTTILSKGAHSMTADGEEPKFCGHRAKAYDLIVLAQKELDTAIDQFDSGSCGGHAPSPAPAPTPAPNTTPDGRKP